MDEGPSTMSLPTPVRIAVVGAGVIGPRHAESIVRCPDALLVCFVDRSTGAQQTAKAFDLPLFTSVGELLDSALLVDAAVVCTPNHTHVAISKALLAAGIHVLVEKPISTSVPDARDLVAFAKATNLTLLVGHHRRFNPYVVATKKVLESGVVGRPIAVNGLWTLFKPESYYQPPMEWHASSESGGVTMINLIHDIDILQYLFGPIVRVHAEQPIAQRGHAADEGAAILLRFASGVVGTFIALDSTPSGHSFESGTGENPIIPKTGQDFYRVFGSEGTLSVPDMTLSRYAHGTVKGWSEALVESRVAVGNAIPFDLQIAHFVRVVKGSDRPNCTGEEGLRALVVVEAVKQAMAGGGSIDIHL